MMSRGRVRVRMERIVISWGVIYRVWWYGKMELRIIVKMIRKMD